MSLRVRILIFLAALLVIVATNVPMPWGMVIACGVYLAVMWKPLRDDH